MRHDAVSTTVVRLHHTQRTVAETRRVSVVGRVVVDGRLSGELLAGARRAHAHALNPVVVGEHDDETPSPMMGSGESYGGGKMLRRRLRQGAACAAGQGSNARPLACGAQLASHARAWLGWSHMRGVLLRCATGCCW